MSTNRSYKNRFLEIITSAPVKLALLTGLILLSKGSFAEDALVEAEAVVKDTYNGSIKTYLYIGEAIAAIVTLIFTRNIKVLGGVFALAMFMNVVAVLGKL